MGKVCILLFSVFGESGSRATLAPCSIGVGSSSHLVSYHCYVLRHLLDDGATVVHDLEGALVITFSSLREYLMLTASAAVDGVVIRTAADMAATAMNVVTDVGDTTCVHTRLIAVPQDTMDAVTDILMENMSGACSTRTA